MATAFNYIGFFPFCVGIDPQFKATVGGGALQDAYSAVLKVSLEDAMALYWKSFSARILANFSWSSVVGTPPPPPIQFSVQSYSLNADTDTSIFSGSEKQNEPRLRVCFDEGIEPLIVANLPVDGGGNMEFFLNLFFNRTPGFLPQRNAPRVLVKTQEEYPKNKNDEVYVNMFFSCVHRAPNLYTSFQILNSPHGWIPPNDANIYVESTIDVIINGNVYSAETVSSFFLGDVPPSNPKFQVIINTIEGFE